MRDIAIVGSGIAGLVAAHALRRANQDVTIYTDRSAEQWLHESRPTGTAARFEMALAYERELGLNHWDAVAPRGEGVFLTFCPTLHKPLVTLLGRCARPFQAVDLRLQCHRWLSDFDGRVVHESVTVERLDEIAEKHELTIVAAGRAELSRLFERNEARSAYRERQRNLAMVITVGGPERLPDLPLLPVKFDFLGTDGEIFFIPYWHKDHGRSWNILVEAKPGSRMDCFKNVKTGDEAVATMKAVIKELFPWDEPFVRDMELADPLGWLTGAVTPAVRNPVGRLPSGRVVTALGDTAISYDPIAAQGANNGIKQARQLVADILDNDKRPFNASWMRRTFETYWREHASYATTFSNLLLEPLTAPAKELLIAQYGSDGRIDNYSGAQRIADAFFENFNDPASLTPAFTDMRLARETIATMTRQPWLWNAIRGRAAIARDQLRPRAA
jgi:2-polyprenyl-6-methoxyphenol hydroxylase-like FAD-dependent oxidoreductase